MSIFNFDDIIKELQDGAIEAAKSVAVKMLEEAESDAKEFISLAAPSIGRYMELLISQKISFDEFKSLMMGLLDLAKMNALSLGGLAEIEVDRTRNTMLKVVTEMLGNVAGKFI